LEFEVNTYTTNFQGRPRVAIDPVGNFVVVWDGYGVGDDTSNNSIQAQRFDASGSAVGSEFQVNTFTTGYQVRPSVAADAAGNFVVVWDGNGTSGAYGIHGQHYDASGSAVGSEFEVNTYTTNFQGRPRVAIDPIGNFVVVWDGYGVGGDTSGNSIQAQLYAGEFAAVPAVSPLGWIALMALLLGTAALRLRRR
jgi:hypothetical protein